MDNNKPTDKPAHVAQLRRILVVEDDATTREQLKTLLEAEEGLVVETAGDGQEALEALNEQNFSICLTDMKLPSMDGIELIEAVKRQQIPVAMIVMTGFGSVNHAVQAMRVGANDFLTKPIDYDHLRLVIERALRDRELQDELMALREKLGERYSFQNMISKSPRMHAVFELINNIAHTATTVVIEGETGTGKEQVARAIHRASEQARHGKMVAINCAALPESLLESELFGHEKGSFTGAVSQRVGRFEMADGGTLFLDEIGEIPASMQAKLLRVLQERCFERVGGTQSISVDVRVIAASNKSLLKLVEQGKFREDLYYRLNVVRIELPPLRDRPEDIPLLVTHFAQKYAPPGEEPKKISPEAMNVLLSYGWRGNIRELENVMERVCVTTLGDTVQAENLPPEITNPEKPKASLKIDMSRPLPQFLRDVTADIEKQYIQKALRKSRGHVGRCAKICGLSRRSISAKLAEYSIDKDSFKES